MVSTTVRISAETRERLRELAQKEKGTLQSVIEKAIETYRRESLLEEANRAYERLMSDAIEGDGTLFAGQDGVEAAWKVVQPVLGSVTPVHEYESGTWGPPEAEKLTAGICGCDSPVWLLPDGKLL